MGRVKQGEEKGGKKRRNGTRERKGGKERVRGKRKREMAEWKGEKRGRKEGRS